VVDEGGGEIGDIHGHCFNGFVEDYLKKAAKNGIVVNGKIVWIDIQQNETAENIWKAQATVRFNDDEVTEAKKCSMESGWKEHWI
jgi:hypothetical protein